MNKPLDLIVIEIKNKKDYPVLEDGDFIVKSKDSKIIRFLRWLSGT